MKVASKRCAKLTRVITGVGYRQFCTPSIDNFAQ